MINKQHLIFALNLSSTIFGALEKDIYNCFSAHEWMEFNKSCNLIGSWNRQNFFELIYFREQISSYQSFAFFTFPYTINQRLSLFTFRWKSPLVNSMQVFELVRVCLAACNLAL